MNRWLLVGLILFLFVSPVSAWLSGWDYRQDINFSEKLDSYQMLINLNDSNVGANWSWSNNNSIRFVNSTDNELNYWIENWSSSANTSEIWINATANNTVYMYYGNSGASSESNGSFVFEEFYNKYSTTGWTLVNGLTVTTSGDYLRFYGPDTGANQYTTRYDLTRITTSFSSMLDK